MIHVIKSIKRPSSEILKGFLDLASATIHEASGKKGYIDCAIKSIHPGLKICGPAFTVHCAPDLGVMHSDLTKWRQILFKGIPLRPLWHALLAFARTTQRPV